MFIRNKYSKIYFKIIKKARKEKRTKGNGIYYERHHVYPKKIRPKISNLSLYPINGVLLTAKEHILCHRLLCKFTIGEYYLKSLRAFHSMCFCNNGGRNIRYPSLRQLSKARECMRIAMQGKRGIKGAPKWSNTSTIDEFESLLKNLLLSSTPSEIGRMYSVSCSTITTWMKKLHIPKKPKKIKIKKFEKTREYETGSAHPRAKKFRLISPNNQEYILNGNLKSICNDLNLSWQALYGNLDKGKIKIDRSKHKNLVRATDKFFNSIGWELKSW